MVVRLWKRPSGRNAVEVKDNRGSRYYGFVTGGELLYREIMQHGARMASNYGRCRGPAEGAVWELLKEDNIRR